MIKTYIISTRDPEKIWELSRNAVSDKDYYQKVVNYLINKSHLGQAQNKANSEIEEHVTELMLSSSLLKQQEYESHTQVFHQYKVPSKKFDRSRGFGIYQSNQEE